MITVNGWCAGGKGGGGGRLGECSVKGGNGERLLPKNFLQPFLETIDRRRCNDGSRDLIPVFHNPHRKFRPSPSAVARTLECLQGVLS